MWALKVLNEPSIQPVLYIYMHLPMLILRGPHVIIITRQRTHNIQEHGMMINIIKHVHYYGPRKLALNSFVENFPKIFRSLFGGLNSVRMGRNLGERIFRSVLSVRLVLPFPKSAHSPKSDIVCKICSQNSEIEGTLIETIRLEAKMAKMFDQNPSRRNPGRNHSIRSQFGQHVRPES